jgi:tRNA(His) 5'-end guanylyltransferase
MHKVYSLTPAFNVMHILNNKKTLHTYWQQKAQQTHEKCEKSLAFWSARHNGVWEMDL